jgi:cobalt-zinc-cadmium efflux system outer membrane protein
VQTQAQPNNPKPASAPASPPQQTAAAASPSQQTAAAASPSQQTAAAGSSPQQTAAPAAQLLQDDRALARWVLSHSQEVAAAAAEVLGARAAHRGSRLLPNPVVDVSVGNFPLGKTDGKKYGLDESLIYGVGLSELVELGKREPRIAAAQLHAQAAQGRLSATLGDRVADARQALARLIYAQARAEELDSSLTQARGAAEVAKGRLDHAALSGVDYDRLLIDLAGIQTEAAHAHAEAEGAAAECTAALLAPCNLANVSVEALTPSAPVPTQWGEAELAGRADVKALKLESNAAQREADLAAARAIPDLTFRLGYAHDTFTGDLNNSLALSISAPLPFFDTGLHAKEEALARATQYSRLAGGTVTHARSDVTSLYTRKSAIEGVLNTLEQDALPRANGVLAAEEQGLREGQLDITDLLLVRREAIALRLQALDLRFELFTIRNDLRHVLGLDQALAQR